MSSLSNLFLFFSFYMFMPVLPVFVMDMNGDELQAGMVVGVFTVTSLLIRPYTGQVLDRMGRRRILILGLAIFLFPILIYNGITSVSVILLLRAVQGIGWGIATTAYGTIVSDLVVQQRRAEGMAHFGLSLNIPMTCAPFLGIWLLQIYGFPAVFTAAGVSTAFSILLARFIKSPSTPEFSGLAANRIPKKESSTLIEKTSLFPSFLMMMTALPHGGIFSAIMLFGQQAGIPNVGWFFLAYAVIVVLSRPIAGKAADRKGHAYVLFPGGAAVALGLLVLSYSTGTVSLIVAAVLYGMGFASIQPVLQAWTISRVSPQRRGAANGTFYSAFDLGIGVGAVLVGFLARSSDYAAIFRMMIVFMVVYLLFYGTYLLRKGEKN